METICEFYEISVEEKADTTNRLAMAAINAGHEVWIIPADSFFFDEDDRVKALARKAPRSKYKSAEVFARDMLGKKVLEELITVGDLDVLFLRSDPSSELVNRTWARRVGLDFGRAAMRRGVLVVNDPNGLSTALNKMYFQLFPTSIRPRTIISRNHKQIKDFALKQGKNIVLKPLQGPGGEGIFFVRTDEMSNLNQIIDTLGSGGYIIAQEFLEGANQGDTRLFLMNGQPFKYKGHYAAYRRVRTGGHDSSGFLGESTFEKAELTDEILEVAEVVRPKLIQDGMFLVRLDIIDGKLIEINVFTPGGLEIAQQFEGVNFFQGVIAALERKVSYRNENNPNFSNLELTVL